MRKNNPSKTDQILDLLLDALLERQQQRSSASFPQSSEAVPEVESDIQPEVITQPAAQEINDPPPNDATRDSLEEIATIISAIDEAKPPLPVVAEPAEPSVMSSFPEKLPSIHLEQMLGRLAIFLVVLIIIINIPFNRYGTSLARAMPDTQSLVIRDGLVLKGSDEKIYVLENNQKRWITTLDAFTQYGYRWEQVHLVEDAFLDQFENGRPLYLLQKCTQSPHVYALENGEKRWIKDIPTFETEGFVWEDIRFVSCSQLRNMPDGVPIPPDAGDPPQP